MELGEVLSTCDRDCNPASSCSTTA